MKYTYANIKINKKEDLTLLSLSFWRTGTNFSEAHSSSKLQYDHNTLMLENTEILFKEKGKTQIIIQT